LVLSSRFARVQEGHQKTALKNIIIPNIEERGKRLAIRTQKNNPIFEI
jgi:hypothetical protein